MCNIHYVAYSGTACTIGCAFSPVPAALWSCLPVIGASTVDALELELWRAGLCPLQCTFLTPYTVLGQMQRNLRDSDMNK